MKEIRKFNSASEHDTITIAKQLATVFKPNDVVLLEGDLGSGKTFFVKAICKIWQTKDEPSSPSFAIIYRYRGPVVVNHFDLYRIKNEFELDNLGWEEYLNDDAVTFIEWPQLIENQLDDYYKIKIAMDGTKRIFTMSSNSRGKS